MRWRRQQRVDAPFPVDVPHPDVLVARDVYTHGAELIRTAEEVGRWERSQQYHSQRTEPYVDDHRTSQEIRLEAATDRRLAPFEESLRRVAECCRALYAGYNDQMRATRDQGLHLLRYSEGSYFRPHTDQGRFDEATVSRVLSFVLFLNHDFEGGRLVFPRQEIVVRPRTGTAVLFPSNFCFPHKARTVRRGVRYSVVTWFE